MVDMNSSIPATTDDRLVENHTTEYGCECKGLRFRSDLHTCPWTGETICRHIYRYRLNARVLLWQAKFEVKLDKIEAVAGPKARQIYAQHGKPQGLILLERELERKPVEEPKFPRGKVGKAMREDYELMQQLQELKVC